MIGRINIVTKLISSKADLNLQDDDGYMPLDWAAQNMRSDIVLESIKEGADLGVESIDGWTLLFI